MRPDHAGRFSPELFERYQRPEKALVGTLAEMYAQGVSMRQGEGGNRGFVRPQLSGEFDQPDQQEPRRGSEGFPGAASFGGLPLSDPWTARYERVREGGVIASRAVLVAVAVDLEGRREPVELAGFVSLGLRQRGLFGVEFVVSDDHAGLKAAIRDPFESLRTAGGGLAALLRAFSEERAGLCA